MFSKKAALAMIGLACATTVVVAATPQSAPRATQASTDTMPPSVRAIQVGTAVDLGVTTSQLLVDLTIADDLSGLGDIYLSLSGPNGLSDHAAMYGGGSTNFRERVAVPLSPFLAPGPWEITAIQGYDRAGNHFYVAEEALRALGNTRFTVTNKATDTKPPKLLSGKVLTPAVSRSVPVAGTSLPYNEVRAQVMVSDAGNRVISGIAFATLTYCLADASKCIVMSNYARNVYGEAKRTLPLSGSVWPYDTIGSYRLSTVNLRDNAGNERWYTGTEFGGDTDFSAMFSSISFDVTP